MGCKNRILYKKNLNDKQCDEKLKNLGINCILSFNNSYVITGSNDGENFQNISVWNIQSGECENLFNLENESS